MSRKADKVQPQALEVIESKAELMIRPPFGVIEEEWQEVAQNLPFINRSNLMKIKCPSGGGLSFTINTLDGPKPATEIVGTVVGIRPYRAHWIEKESKENLPPNCSSQDAQNGIFDSAAYRGIAEPTGNCSNCPYSAYSKDEGRVPCKKYNDIFILQEDQMLPIILRAAPTSDSVIGDYMFQLTQAKTGFQNMLTRFTLKEAVSKQSGKKYSVMVLSRARSLNPEERIFIAQYKGKAAALIAQPIETVDIEAHAIDIPAHVEAPGDF